MNLGSYIEPTYIKISENKLVNNHYAEAMQ